ncbi:MAG TPA: hypothetical protein VEC39_05630 [Vicinamibacterales bacterium]|nr:hypothetical protein [Vicinamibacterales bacterium]
MTRRDRVKAVLRAAGLDRVIGGVRYAGRLALNREFRRLESMNAREYANWKRYRPILEPRLTPTAAPRRALIVTKGTVTGAKIETALIKGLELGGFVPVVLTDRTLAKYFRIAGVRDIVYWDQFLHVEPRVDAERLVAAAHGIDDVQPFTHGGARVGRFALSTSFRSLRVGRLDFTSADTRRTIVDHLAAGIARAEAAHRIADRIRPDLVVFMGNRYTGHAEIMDVCIERGIDVIAWFDGHRSSSLVLKRYHRSNRDQHHASLSDATWELMRSMRWTHREQEALRAELADSYAAGDWYSRGGTQVNKAIVDRTELRARLNLHPAKPTAVVFPHVIWDATLFWGSDLFDNYEDWLIETVRAAAANDAVNWIIKIHPVHVAKSAMEKISGEAGEIAAISQRIGALPPHITLVPPDTDINTYSLFPLMDYCLTVRGTIGIEAASFGVRVLTAGTGRYDHRGFTVDSATAAEYLQRLATLQSMPRMTVAERDLAQRYAYGAFLLRPLPLRAIVISHDRDIEATTRVRVDARTSAELRRAPDLCAFAAWAAGDDEDFLWMTPEREAAVPLGVAQHA